MGNLYSKVWPSKKKDSKLYNVTTMQKKATVLTAVEDIQKLTPEQMQEQFESIYRASHKVLRSLTHNPCGQLSMRIKQCLDENVQQMSKCFAVMDEYRTCVSNMMSEKLADVVTDFEKNAEGEKNGNSDDLLKEDDAIKEEEEDYLIAELEKELKRRVEELKPKAEAENERERSKQQHEEEWVDEHEDIKACA